MSERACTKPGGCTCTDPDATFWICRHASLCVMAHPAVNAGEAFIVPNTPRNPWESIGEWSRRRAAGAVKITNLASDAL